MAADPASVLERAPLSAEALAQLSQGMLTADAGGSQASGGEHGAADVGGGAAPPGAHGTGPASSAVDWDGVFLDDDDDGNASVASDVSFRSVTTARGWPHISRPRAQPAMAAAIADSLGSSGASYADALLRCGSGDARAEAATGTGPDGAGTTARPAPRPPTVRSRPVAADGDGASVVQGRVMLTMPRSRIRRSVRGLPAFRRGELCSVDEEGDEW